MEVVREANGWHLNQNVNSQENVGLNEGIFLLFPTGLKDKEDKIITKTEQNFPNKYNHRATLPV